MVSSRYALPIIGALTLALASLSRTNASFEFPDANLRSIQRHLLRMGEFFPVNRPGDDADAMGEGQPRSPTSGSPSKFSFSSMPSLMNSVYLFSGICFILCLRGLSTPQTAKRGNTLGAIGMAAAILVTFTASGFGNHFFTFLLTATPAAMIGIYIAQYVSMVEMPQLVALFHSFVGLAAMLVALANFHAPDGVERSAQTFGLLEVYFGEFIAGVTFAGSGMSYRLGSLYILPNAATVVAAMKLHELMDSSAIRVPGRHFINLATISAIGILGIVFCMNSGHLTRMICLYTCAGLSVLLGFHLVAAIGGADMPVVISMLNSYSGFALAASGFMLDNSLLIIAGALIGSSGAILSYIMCRGMNRDIMSVILGGFDDAAAAAAPVASPQGNVKATDASAVASDLIGARKVLIVPGYGMAVSKCQGEIAEIARVLVSRGVLVDFGIHPVAGRMPGHMNVLLAEADVPYKMVKEMSEVNPEIASYDVALVVGANDTVNPAALERGTKISGMPVIEVWKCKRVVVMKRSMATGYAAIENPLFTQECTRMLFGNAKITSGDVFGRLNELAQALPMSPGIDLESGLLESGERALADLASAPQPKRTVGVLKDGNDSPLVALAPRFVPVMRKMAIRVLVEGGAGNAAGFSDEEYKRNGAEIAKSAADVLGGADVLLRVSPPPSDMISKIPRDKVLICTLRPAINSALLDQLAKQGVTALAIDEVPRITRAQKLDVKSAMQGLQGYRAVIEAFYALPKLSKASISAAGRVNPAKVFVVGAGVAGLQAVSTAHGLGSQVFATDVRPVTREEVESCGGSEDGSVTGDAFKKAQQDLISNTIKHCDIVICTAAVVGHPSPKIISNEMLRLMKPGSVIVDLATEFGDSKGGWGGNVQASKKDSQTVVEGITILGHSKIETHMPIQASELFSMNMCNLLEDLGGGSNFRINPDDEVIKAMTATTQGRVVWSPSNQGEPPAAARGAPASAPPASAHASVKGGAVGGGFLYQFLTSDSFFAMCLVLSLGIACVLGVSLDPLELKHLTLFGLALIVGYYSVWSVTSSLHTPLMSVTNALSGVIIVGCMVQFGPSWISCYMIFAVIGTFLAAINVAGGFYVTDRMLKMFQV